MYLILPHCITPQTHDGECLTLHRKSVVSDNMRNGEEIVALHIYIFPLMKSLGKSTHVGFYKGPIAINSE